jgi:hypothetical protein
VLILGATGALLLRRRTTGPVGMPAAWRDSAQARRGESTFPVDGGKKLWKTV